MPAEHIDTPICFSQELYDNLPARQDIEVPEQDPVPISDPPMKTVEREPYIAAPAIEEAVNLAIALGRPLLLQGDPGGGKTRLAYVVAYALGLPLEICYIKSTSKAQDLLYSYDAIRRLYDAQLHQSRRTDDEQKALDPNDIRQYIRFGPLGRALVRATYGRRSVVLIDEIDKADLDFPNDLLWELDRQEFRVAEVKDMHYAVNDRHLKPIIIVTHNEEKALPPAFLRRCIFHYVQFPATSAQLQEILAIHNISNLELSQKAIDVLLRLRRLELQKKPGLSELLDWVEYLQAVKTPLEELERVPYIGALLKLQADIDRTRKKDSEPI